MLDFRPFFDLDGGFSMAGGDKGKRLQILSDAQYAALYGKPNFTPEEQEYYFTLNDLEKSYFDSRDSPIVQVYFVLILGYTKYIGVAHEIDWKASQSDIDYILRRHLNGKKLRPAKLSANQKKRIYDQVLKFLKLRHVSDAAESHLLEAAIAAATKDADKTAIFDELIDYLQQNDYLIPSLYKLQLIISQALTFETERLKRIISQQMSAALKEKIQHLLSSKDAHSLSALKKLPRDFTKREVNIELEAFARLKDSVDDIQTLTRTLGLSKQNIEYYGSLVDYYSITQLRTKDHVVATLYIVCYLQTRLRQIGDNFTNALIFKVRKLVADGKTAGKEKVFDALASIQEKIKQASPVLDLFVDSEINEETPFKKIRARAYKHLAAEDIPLVSEYLMNMTVDQLRYEWEYLDKQRGLITGMLRNLFLCLTFEQDESNSLLFEQIQQSKLELQEHGALITFHKKLIPKPLRPHLYQDAEQTVLHPVRAELLLYRKIKAKMEKRELFVQNSHSYESIRVDLLNDDVWKHKPQLLEESRLPALIMPPEQRLQQKIDELHAKMAQVATRLQNGENESVVLSVKSGKTKWTVKRTQKKEEVNNPFFAGMPQTGIVDLMAFVNAQTGFFDQFTHVRPRGKILPGDFEALMACVLASATRFGLYKMADVCNLSLDKLRTIQGNLMRMETLHDACDVVSNAIAQLPIFEHYSIQSGKLHASSDGQKFECRRNTIRTRFSSKYIKTGPGVSGLTLNANHVPVFAKMIGLNDHESHYLFDLLYNNTSEIRPDILSTDTHGVNRFNFALLELSGWSFAPRYANVNKILNELFEVKEANGTWQLKLKKSINVKLILDDWDFIQRVMLSLHRRETSQASLVRKLSGTSKTYQPFKALSEYNRLIKCIYLLDYLDDENLRKFVQRALNRGEAYHQLQRHIEQVNGAKFRGNSDREIDEWYECARLVANCMIYLNSLILSKILKRLENMKREDLVDICKRVSPVAWININLNGTYLFHGAGAPLDIDTLILTAIEKL